MTITEQRSAHKLDHVSGHPITSVIASGEPESQRRKALSCLADAIPHIDAIPNDAGRITNIATTPDFHPGRPVPVGVVVETDRILMPHLVGNDIGCGMHMIVVKNVAPHELPSTLDGHLRHIHFQGGRNVSLSGRQRHAILRHGVPGLLSELEVERSGLLGELDLTQAWKDAGRFSDLGSFATSGIDPAFSDYADIEGETRHDAILGTIGGGNHFVEFGVIESIVDGPFANASSLSKQQLVIIVHSGSLDFGQSVGTRTRDALRASRQIGVDERVLSPATNPSLFERYRDGLGNATNAAFVNRYLIGLATIKALSRSLNRDIEHNLVYDAPHNLVWVEGDKVTHRKGACPARGIGALRGSEYEWLGEPVILPGSMGDGSWLLKGLGANDTLASSAHGAGRKLSRQEARHLAAIPAQLRVVGPVDTKSPALQSRPDILKEIEGRLNEEAPNAYRKIDDVVEPMVEAGMVSKVARIKPLLTVKG